MGELPTGTVTFLFTDLESSTRLWEQHPDAMQDALARHDTLLTEAVEAHHGHVVKSTGDGLHAVFATVDAAIAAAVAGQEALHAASWEPVGAIRVRMGLHTGVAEERAGDYFGPVLNRAEPRLMGVAHAGQILCSQATADLVRGSLPSPVGLEELGRHRLRDLTRPEVVFQVTHPDLPTDFPPLRTLDAFPGNLPIERTALIGRTRELDRLAGLLDDHRLVTLTGVGGVGKTRLALQLAADVVDRFPDGAWLVALASIREPQLVPSAVAAALSIPERPGVDLLGVLADAIGARRLLVVLDNCEHLLDPTARLVDGLLDACPALRIVTTSREALGVEGEQSWPTPSLGLPVEAPEDMLQLAGSEAVTLFVERARAVRPEFELSAANAAVVVALCRRLDGIPLAIELAAARVSALGPQDILERIDQRFLLLTGGSRTAMERHQTLQAAVDWSYDLLDDGERRLFDRLSVFAGGFTLEAAVAVAAEPGAPEVVVLDLLGSLVAKSMVIADGSGASVRYRTLETLRQYGRERLAGDGDVEATRDRHAEYFLALEESLMPRFFSRDQLAASEQRLLEGDNLRGAFDWRVERGEPRLAMRLAQSSAGYGGTGETLRRFEAALALATDLPAAERVEPLAEAAWAAMNAGALARTVELGNESLACAKSSGVAPHAFAFCGIGLAAFWQADAARAIEAMDDAVAAARAANDGSGRRATQLAALLMQSTFVLAQSGETERAITSGEEALVISREIGAPFLWAQALFHLGLALRSTDLERSARLLEESVTLPRLPGMSAAGTSWTHVAIGELRSALGDHAAALAEFAETVEVCRQSGERFVLPAALQGMAHSCRQLGRLDEAAELLGATTGLGEQLGITGGAAAVAARTRATARLRELLGDERFDAAWEAGVALSSDGAIALALAVAAGPDASPAPTRVAAPAGADTGAVFRREGDTWTLAYQGAVVRLRDAKGFRYLARLLAEPGREVHVDDLAAEATAGERAPRSGSGGEALDATASQAYRRRLEELDAEIAEATEWNDTERAARAREEMEAITEQLAGAYGLGGRARTLADTTERVRKAVTNRIRDSITRIGAEHEALGRHLANAVHTGTFCSYDPEQPTPWEL